MLGRAGKRENDHGENLNLAILLQQRDNSALQGLPSVGDPWRTNALMESLLRDLGRGTTMAPTTTGAAVLLMGLAQQQRQQQQVLLL
jgi:hypothetical protein